MLTLSKLPLAPEAIRLLNQFAHKCKNLESRLTSATFRHLRAAQLSLGA